MFREFEMRKPKNSLFEMSYKSVLTVLCMFNTPLLVWVPGSGLGEKRGYGTDEFNGTRVYYRKTHTLVSDSVPRQGGDFSGEFKGCTKMRTDEGSNDIKRPGTLEPPRVFRVTTSVAVPTRSRVGR